MNRPRLHAARVIAGHQLKETLLSPVVYVGLSLGLFFGHFSIATFVASIDTGGFDPTRNPAGDAAIRSIAGIFGNSFVASLFAEGPFLLALVLAGGPVFIALAIASVFRFGIERTTGAIELITCGPADGPAYCLGTLLKDALLAAGVILVLLIFFGVEAIASNMVLGPAFAAAVPAVFLLALYLSAAGVLCSVVAGGAAAALLLFICLQAVLLLPLVGALSISGAAVHQVAATVQWASPFAWAFHGHRLLGDGSVGWFLASCGSLLLVAGALLVAAASLLSRKGVRP